MAQVLTQPTEILWRWWRTLWRGLKEGRCVDGAVGGNGRGWGRGLECPDSLGGW